MLDLSVKLKGKGLLGLRADRRVEIKSRNNGAAFFISGKDIHSVCKMMKRGTNNHIEKDINGFIGHI